MTLYSYVVARDYGFAPNPFHGFCTLATCKKVIRRVAAVGDWVVGTGSARYHRTGQLIFAMRVSETLTFDAYWADDRFALKRPDLTGSRMRAFGDNIYRHEGDEWRQLDSHHSLPGGIVNDLNLADDTETDRVLVAEDFAYFGANAKPIPDAFVGEGPHNICARRGHKKTFDAQTEAGFLEWLDRLPRGCSGRPDRWP